MRLIKQVALNFSQITHYVEGSAMTSCTVVGEVHDEFKV